MNLLARKAIFSLQKRFLDFDFSAEGKVGGREMGASPIFIIGAPRTGSTLLYQALVIRFHVAYLSNILSLFPSRISTLVQVIGKKNFYYNRIKKSNLGYIAGFFSPSEAGNVHKLWFENAITSAEKKACVDTVAYMEFVASGSFLGKNMFDVYRLENISRVFPSVRFIHIRRDPLYTAQSILLARKKVFGDYAEWWSVKPPGSENVLRESPAYQVLWQITQINDHIVGQLNKLGHKYVEINYDELCVDPESVMQNLAEQFALVKKTRVPVLRMGGSNTNVRVGDSLWRELRDIYEKYFHRATA